MNEILLTNSALPVTCGCDFCVAAEPFFHADRTVDFNVLIYVTSGEIFVTEESEGLNGVPVQTDYRVLPNQLLFLKSGVRHFGKRACPKGTSWFFIHFKTEEKPAAPLNGFSEPLQQYEPAEFSAILPKMLESESIEPKLRELVEFFRSGELNQNQQRVRWEINARVFAFLSDLIVPTAQKNPPTKADEISSFLQKNINKPFSAEELEKNLFLSYKYMAALFKREKGVTMQQFHSRLRMEEAQRLLRSTALSVGEISERLGFSDMLYFSRCFHNFCGEAPTAYRRRSIENY